MSRFTLSAIIASLLALTLDIIAAQAQTRVFVAAQGSDANPCTFAQPCRTFQHAHNVAAAGGEIDVLDPAGYGQLSITKSITVQGHGFAGIAVPGGGVFGIFIAAGATDVVNLAGLIIEGNGGSGNGIGLQSARFVSIENCVIRNMTNRGLTLSPTGSTDIVVSNTVVASTGVQNIFLSPQGNGLAVKATFNRIELYDGGISGGGLLVNGSASTGKIDVTVSDSVSANHPNSAFAASTGLGQAQVFMTLVRSVAANSNNGVSSFGSGAFVRLAQSTISGNSLSFIADSSGVVSTFGDNNIVDNTNFFGSLTTISKQ